MGAWGPAGLVGRSLRARTLDEFAWWAGVSLSMGYSSRVSKSKQRHLTN